jgi:hypothetical protein
MRVKIVIGVFLLAGLLLGGIIIIKVALSSRHPFAVQGPGPAHAQTNLSAPKSDNASNAVAVVQSPVNPESEQERRARIDVELDDIRENLANQNAEAIAMKLFNSEPEVRTEAAQAIKVLDYTNGIPLLKEAMAKTDDIREKAKILEVIEFLELPSETDPESLRLLQSTNQSRGNDAANGRKPAKNWP